MIESEATDAVQIVASKPRVSLLHLCRSLLLIFVGINYLLAYVGFYSLGSYTDYANFGRVLLPLLMLYWAWGFRRGQFPSWAEPIEAMCLFLCGIGLAEISRALSLFTIGMLFRGLYGELSTGALRWVFYLAAYAAMVLVFLQSNDMPGDDIVGMALALSLVTALARVLVEGLSKHEKAQRREYELNAASKALASIRVYDEVGDAIIGPLMAFTSDEHTTGAVLVAMASERGELTVTAVSTVVRRHCIRQRLPVDGDVQQLLLRVRGSGENVIVKIKEWHKYVDDHLLLGERTPKLKDVVFVPFLGDNEVLGGIIFGAKAGQLKEVSESLTALAATAAITIQSIQSRERFVSLVRNSNDVITVLGSDGKIAYQSSATRRLFGHRSDRHIGAALKQLVKPEQHWVVDDLLSSVIAQPGMPTSAEWEWWHAEGYWVYTETIATNLLQEPSVRAIVFNTRDVTERKLLEEKLRHQASHDALTGLANRGFFHDRITCALARCARNKTRVAVMYLDLDDFKKINDTFGHDAGDQLLKVFSAILRASVRAYDTASRLGGDEFAILVEDVTTEDVPIAVANRILQEAKNPLVFASREALIRTSIGIALSGIGDTADSLLHKADKAMYTSKAGGKDRYKVYALDMDEPSTKPAEVQRWPDGAAGKVIGSGRAGCDNPPPEVIP